MMVPLLLSIREAQGEHGIAMERFYRYVGISRQGFSKAAKGFAEENLLMEELIGLVKSYRQSKDRRAGSRSLFYNLDIKERSDQTPPSTDGPRYGGKGIVQRNQKDN